MQTLVSIAVGIGLSAACGFRVFVPLLALNLAARGGHLPLAPGFAWIGSTPALWAFATATVLEVAAYKVPWLDHLLDVAATPAAVVAGMLATASVVADLPPVVRLFVAIVGGGGAAGIVQAATVLMRMKSTVVTGGLANPLFATAELGGALVTSFLALVLPLIGLMVVAGLCVVVFSRRASP
jgi:hypothetical protein